MPTKHFLADLREAGAPHRYPRLSQIKSGEYEGSISFNFHQAELDTTIEFQVVISGMWIFSRPLSFYLSFSFSFSFPVGMRLSHNPLLTVRLLDASDYPTDHSFGVFAASDNVAPPVTKALERAQDKGSFSGVSINDMLVAVDRILCDALRNSPEGLGRENDFDDSDQSMDNYEGLSDDKIPEDAFDTPPRRSHQSRQKLRKDIRAVKAAGFKVGCLGEADGTVLVAVSRRIAKLGISEEAMNAWNLEAEEYLVLLIRYPNSYCDMQEILDMADAATKAIEMRVGLCNSYKPTFHTATRVFQRSFEPTETDMNTSGQPFRALFIGPPLERLLNERLLEILRIRKMHGFTWTGAEFFFHVNQGKSLGFNKTNDQRFSLPDTWLSPPPDTVASDHFLEQICDMTQVSFPLVAWQFTLRHFVKCTEFCLVCHCKTFDKFEALKPYVCSNELCLYQYMTYGMGPSLEHEIRSQPLVVDLLVSLAYARANSRRLQDFPNGLGIQVPAIEPKQSSQNWTTSSKFYKGHWKNSTKDLLCKETSNLSPGDWIVAIDQIGKAAHLRIGQVKSSTCVSILEVGGLENKQFRHGTLLEEGHVNFVLYDHNFDDLSIPHKQAMICMLLDTLPDVSSLQLYLGPVGSKNLLSSCRERINPAALDLLRWIVSSNRSCIIQDSGLDSHLVTKMQGFIQFRLVQGAPDKEDRFVKSIKSELVSENSKYPTLFAWHGSPIENWHSILREGLHFREAAHGRAYGDGVYMSSHFATSVAYATPVARSIPVGHPTSSNWRWSNSILDMHSVLSLNEVVNRTDKFFCCTPHFVVQQLDWIQPRYLFVGCSGSSKLSPHGGSPHASSRCMQVYEQDPRHQAYGPADSLILIPISAARSKQQNLFSKSLSSGSLEKQTPQKGDPRSFHQKPEANSTALQYADRASISTATEDIILLLSDSEVESRKGSSTLTRALGQPMHNPSLPTAMQSTRQTDFIPGTLKKSSLPLIPPPKSASIPATKLLQKHLQAILKVQQKESPTELGWYIDPNLTGNLYQWIVELHSFEPTLPLAKDLKAWHLTSVVLEIRFPQNFPMSPPFVRVIRPRFVEFAAGGGGHVTSGGAMCMELLTSSGWSPVASMESVLLQVRMAISTTEPRPARLHMGSQNDYSASEAVSAFKRACRHHGWEIPRDMDSLSL